MSFRRARDFDHSLDRTGTAFDHRSHTLFFDRRKTASKVSGTHRILAHRFTILQCLVVCILDLLFRGLRCRTGCQQPVKADCLNDLLKDRGTSGFYKLIKKAADYNISGKSARIITSAAFCSDYQILQRHLHSRSMLQLFQRLTNPGDSFFDRRNRSSFILDPDPG